MSFQQNKFKEIADTIRSLSERTNKIKPSKFATEISSIHEAALMRGHENGLDSGKEIQKRERWDNHIESLKNGWTYGFAGRGINDETFTPYTDVKMNAGYNITGLFQYCGITNLKDILVRYGATLDLALGANAANLFANSKVTHIPRLLLNSATGFATAFNSCTDLVSIDELYVPKVTSFSNTFQNCTNLEEIRITSEIKINGFDVHWSEKLSHESLLSIINALANKTADTSGTEWVCTLGTENLNKLSATEIAVATEKGWSLV